MPRIFGDGRIADRVLPMRPCPDLRRDILPLAAGREHLGKLRRHMETVVPGAALCRVHVLGARQKAIDQDKLRQQVRPGMRKHIGSLAAHVMPGDTDLAHAEMLDQRGDIRGDGFLVVAVRRPFVRSGRLLEDRERQP
jgi:hypothetical protein